MKLWTKVAAATIVAAVGIAQATAAGTAGDFATAFRLARQHLLAGEYLAAIALVRPFALTPSDTVRDDGAFQVWDQMQAMVSGEASRLNRSADDPPDPATVARVAGATTRDALSAIVAGARGTRVVMLNENHRTPCQRIFAAKVAAALRPLGYDTLALEALAVDQPSRTRELGRRGYPIFADGFYTRDPAFGYLLRRALTLGYAPFAYEPDPPGSDETDAFRARERGQARKLHAYLQAHPDAKIFVYGGGGHLAERPLSDGSKMMGQWLRELSGIDPLTIDQNQLQPGTALRRRLVRSMPTSDAMLFRGSAPLVVGSMAGRVDLQLLPMAARMREGRPACLSGKDRRTRTISVASRAKGPVLLQAFGKHDVPGAVPLDQTIVAPGTTRSTLLLPAGPVRLVRRSR